jgi:methylated-DNA-[protein]-cysteine S-methyltransferase
VDCGWIESPVGRLWVAGDRAGLQEIRFGDASPITGGLASEPMPWDAGAGLIEAVRAQLGEYFGGQRRSFDLPLSPQGTEFQQRVWDALRSIPYGQTISYGDLAERIADPRAARAVGLAVGSNPLPIVIPCHRVIGADGSMTGFGGGIERKEILLQLEGALGERQDSLF